MCKALSRKGIIEELKNIITASTARKERFTDIEICSLDDNHEANNEIENVLNSSTDSELAAFSTALSNGADVCMHGWELNGEYHFLHNERGCII